jgi:hypothetical protein
MKSSVFVSLRHARACRGHNEGEKMGGFTDFLFRSGSKEILDWQDHALDRQKEKERRVEGVRAFSSEAEPRSRKEHGKIKT